MVVDVVAILVLHVNPLGPFQILLISTVHSSNRKIEGEPSQCTFMILEWNFGPLLIFFVKNFCTSRHSRFSFLATHLPQLISKAAYSWRMYEISCNFTRHLLTVEQNLREKISRVVLPSKGAAENFSSTLVCHLLITRNVVFLEARTSRLWDPTWWLNKGNVSMNDR